MKPWLDWASLTKPLNWTSSLSDLQLDITVAAVFGQRYAVRVAQSYVWEALCKAVMQLRKVTNMDQGLAYLAD